MCTLPLALVYPRPYMCVGQMLDKDKGRQMAKAVSKIGSREQRKKLKPNGKPYFEGFERGVDLGYRKGQSGGAWVLRRYLGERKYAVESIGRADDDPTETGALSYEAVRGLARDRMKALAEEARIANDGPPLTVESAVAEYLAGREERELANVVGKGRKAGEPKGLKKDARSRLTKHALADKKLAATALAALSADTLSRWRKGLKMKPGSAQRLVNDLRAALNAAARLHRDKLPPSIRDAIKDGLASVHASAPVAREAQVLPDADVRRIITAAWEIDSEGGWGGDLARLVVALAATGTRFSQAIRMTVGDVQPEQGRLMVPVSRKGRGVKQATHTSVRVGEDVIAALAAATVGRRGGEALFLRPHWEQVGPAKWERRERRPWFSSAEITRPFAAIIARAGLAAGTTAYALRHSGIVRGLRAGLPVRLVAALHDTSSAMIEKFYSAYIVDAMDELAAKAIIPLTTESADVVKLRAAS